MRHFKSAIIAIVAVVSCLPYHARATERSEVDAPFKMILRLWPSYFTDPTLLTELRQSLTRYHGLFDEVWLCMDFNSLSMENHRATAEAMSRAAQQLRSMGITVSIEGISIGHGDDFASDNQSELEKDSWGKIVDCRGVTTRMSYCPRQAPFLQYLSEVYALYAEPCQPSTVMLDDDLRVTHHAPAEQLCFCDTCLALFNRQTGGHWQRETLVEALNANAGNGALRREWIAFGEESLAGVARTIAHSVHSVSPKTRMGLEHANFHHELLNGYDWNRTFDAMERETGLAPVSRPGSGFYNDYSPRGMIDKALDMARQIRRLSPSVEQIAAEVEGYRHCATGKSPHGLCVESGLYLAMGTTQLSYAIVCSGAEPMAWYADNYFRELSAWRDYYKEFQSFNLGTEPGGVDPYISPNAALRDLGPNDPSMAWTVTYAGSMAAAFAPLGVPLCPDGRHAVVLMMDNYTVADISATEAQRLFTTRGVVFDRAAWQEMQRMGYDRLLHSTATPDSLSGVECFVAPKGGRVAVIDSYNAALSGAERLNLLHAIDWAADERLPVLSETSPQMMVVPRIDSTGALRSVVLLNCTISDQHDVRLRLRGCADRRHCSLIWKRAGKKDVRLHPEADGKDLIVRVPMLEAWNTGWIAVRNR